MYYKYFFFDFDGMLADTYAHTAKAFTKAIKDARNEVISEKLVYDKLKVSFGECYTFFNVTSDEKLLFKKYHEDFTFKPEPTLYLPIVKLLKEIKASGGKNFIYTNRNETLYEYLEKFEIKDLFEDFIISANKPDPTPLLNMIEKHNLDKSKCVVVGDRSLDVDGAYNAKVDGILYDVDSRVFLHHGTYVIKTINELYNFIDRPYKIKHNYHTHTSRCGHAIGSDEEYVISAIKAGYQTLGFSDHVMIPDLNRNYDYFDSLALLKEKYKDQIDIKIALEVEWFDAYIDFYRKLKKEKSVDYLIFGNHSYMDSSCKARKDEQMIFIESFDDDTYFDKYYECLSNAVKSGLFKYIAHPDCFLKGYGKWDDKTIAFTHKIAKLLQDYNMYAELSASGVRSRKYFEYNGKQYAPYPFKEFYKILSEYNITFVLGCDSHSPSQLDDDAVKFICDMAKELNLNVKYKLEDL